MLEADQKVKATGDSIAREKAELAKDSAEAEISKRAVAADSEAVARAQHTEEDVENRMAQQQDDASNEADAIAHQMDELKRSTAAAKQEQKNAQQVTVVELSGWSDLICGLRRRQLP